MANVLERFRNKLIAEIKRLTKEGRLTCTDFNAYTGRIEKATPGTILSLVYTNKGDIKAAVNELICET